MKILQVHNYYRQPGGEDEVFSAETEILGQKENEVLTYTADNSSIDINSRLKLTVNTIWSESSRRRFFKLLKDNRPDVVHFHNTFPLISPSAYYACRHFGIPVVQTLHNYRLICPAALLYRDKAICESCFKGCLFLPGIRHRCYHNSPFRTAVISLMLNFHRLLGTWKDKVDFYIALTEFARNKFIEGGLPGEKILVKPNFIYPDPGNKEEKERYVFFAGRLTPEKGIMTLLEAWKSLENIPLKIAGAGPLDNEVVAFIKKEGIKNVDFLGRRRHSEVIELMKKAYCLLLPSEWYECFSVTMIEAFACGTTVIASRLGAMAEIIEDGKTGIFFKPRDPQALALAVNYAWNSPELVQRISQSARREYELKYTEKINYKLLMNIYQKAIDGHNKGHA